MKLAPKLTILFLLLAIVPTAIVGYLAYENGRRTIVKETIDHLVSINLFKNNELKRWIEDNKSRIEELALRPLVRHYATVLTKHDTPDPAYRKAKGSIVEDHLKARLKYGGFFELFIMCPRHGLISASTDEKQEGKYRDTDPYFIEGKSHTYIQGIYYSPVLEQPAMTISTPMKDKQGNLMGVLGGRLDLGELSKIIALQTGKSPTEDTYLVNTFNFFVTEPRFGQGYALKKAVRTEGVEAGLSGKDGVGFYKDYRGVPVIGAYKWLPEFNMCIITEIDQAEAFAPIVHLAWVITAIASAISIATGLLGLFFARTITRPVRKLAAGAEKIGAGNLEHRVGTASKDEIGELSKAFDRMTESLKGTTVSRDELALSEERFRIGATSAGDLIWDWNISNGRLDWFGDIDEILGYQPGEFPRTIDAWGEAIHNDDVARVNATLERHLREGELYYEEYRIRCRDGTYRYWTDQGTAMRDEKGEAYRMIGACTDLTKRKRAEEEIRKSEQRFRRLVDSNIIGVIIANMERIIEANDIFLQMIGYTRDELQRNEVNWQGITPPEYAAADRKGLEEMLSRGACTPFEKEYFRKDGSRVPFLIGASMLTREPLTWICFVLDLIERKRAEEALKESERKYRQVVENATEIIYSINTKGNFTYGNPAGLKVTGFSLEELRQFNYQDLVVPEHRERIMGIYIKQFRERQATTYVEFPFFNKSGEVVWFGQNASLVIEDGKVVGFHIIARDITEHKNAEKTLQESENRYRTLVENSNDGIALVKGDIHLYVNQKFLEIFGYNHIEEIVGRPISITIHPDDRDRVVEMNRRRQTKEGEPSKYEFKGIRKDGSIVYIEVAATKTTYQGKAVSLSYHRDITERKRAEEALRRSEEKYRTILETIEESYFEVDIAGNFTFFNDSLCRLLGYSRDEMMGMNNRQYTDNENAQKLYQTFNRVYRTGKPSKEFDWEIIRKEGTKRSIEASVSLIKDPSDNRIGFKGIVRDVTERKRIEQEKTTLEEQLRQSQKIEAIGRLAGGIAHDFNNLLTVIKGYSQLSLIELKEGDPLKGNIEEIKKASDRAADLTRQLLAFSRRQILEMKVLDLNTVLRDMDKMLHRLIGEDIELVTVFTDDLGRVKTDPGWVEQIIMNLAVNARDAMPSVGKLTIETANVELDGAYARNHIAVTPGRYVMLSVSDTGVGMTPEVRQQVFEPFFTTKEKGKGTGLGLSTVYGIVKQSGGNIWVYSEPGQGTTFKIYLPRVDEALEELKERVEVKEVPRGTETILIVEDEEDVLKLAERILSRQGYTVLQTSSTSKALEICKERKDSLHLILTDVVMPQMSGRQLIERCRETRQDFKILYMSGYTDNAITHHGVLEKGMNYLQKPFTVDGLARKVREVLDK